MRVLPLLLLTACAASGVLEPIEDTATAAPPPPPPPQSACGAVSTWDLTVEGVVVDAAGDPIARAVVRLEDRAWTPGDVLGEALSDVHGGFRLPVSGLTAVEDCWGTLLDYVLTGTTDTAYGERPLNPPLSNAIQDGSLYADVRARPLSLDAIAR